jgi:hypothetical protein
LKKARNKKGNKKFSESKEITTYQNLWDKMKGVLRGKFMPTFKNQRNNYQTT